MRSAQEGEVRLVRWWLGTTHFELIFVCGMS